MSVNLIQCLIIDSTEGAGDVEIPAVVKRAEEAEARAERLSIVAQERENKCNALKKRCRSLKKELHNSTVATQSAESRVAQSVLLVKQLEKKCAALAKMCEEFKLGKTAQKEMWQSGKIKSSS